MEQAVGSVTGKVVDLLCGVAKKEISYTWNCSKNVENLKNEVEKLSGMKGRVQQQIHLATSKAEVLLEGVQEWVNKADVEISNATDFIAEEAEAKKTCCNLRLCVNLSTLRHYSKAATEKTTFLQKHQENGKYFETCVSLPAPIPRFTDLYQSKNLEEINTQKSTLEKIIEAIEDDMIQVVGINGLGGVGKTTLASEVAKRMKNQFADIVFVTVSQTIDAKTIQEKVQAAASRIIKGEKVIIILDDVWEEVEFDKLGIPCLSEHMNCKILLTSRSRDVCAAMNAKVIELNPLQDKEAWTLFERVVGKSEWEGKLKQVALKVVKECGGLPLFIQAVGKALKGKEIRIWEAALQRLQDPTDKDIPFKTKQIEKLMLSYDYLEDEVAKSCFLLCSMFPEDRFIELDTLTHYGLALGMLNNPDNIHDAEDRVRMATDTLKSSFLLLPSEDYDDYFKMHDLIRDMALFITSKGDDMCLVKSGKGLREWPPRIDDIKSYKKISLMGNKISKLPDDEVLDLPHLDTFLIQDNILTVVPNEFFRGMKKLKVLDMSSNFISSLPQSLKQLKELVMLDLSQSRALREISILGELTCLEILKLRYSFGITNIPEEIGRLTKLRLLDVHYCSLSYVTPGVISKLIRLEELYLWLTNEANCNFLVELSELTLLKVLHLYVPELHYIPKIETLIEFDIGTSGVTFNDPYKRCLQYSGYVGSLTMPIRKLFQLTESLRLSNIKDVENILPDLYQDGFNELRYICLWSCENVKSLVRTCDDLDAMQISNEYGPMKTKGKFFSQLEKIEVKWLDRLELLWDYPHQYISFCNLAEIIIENCPSILKLFPVSVAQGLVNLRELKISHCERLVVVISNGDEQTTGSEIELVKQDTDIMFSLTEVHLSKLPKLECFYSGHSTINYPSLEKIKLENCPSMKRWSYGENHTTNIKFYHQEREWSINDYIARQPQKNGNLMMSKGSNIMSDESTSEE